MEKEMNEKSTEIENRSFNLIKFVFCDESGMEFLGCMTFTKTLEEILLFISSIFHPTPWPTFGKLHSTGEFDLRQKRKVVR